MPSENTSAAWRAFYAHPDYDPHNASFRNLITAVVRAEHEAAHEQAEAKLRESIDSWRAKAAQLVDERRKHADAIKPGSMTCGTCSLFRPSMDGQGTCHWNPPTHEGFGRTYSGGFCQSWTDDELIPQGGKR